VFDYVYERFTQTGLFCLQHREYSVPVGRCVRDAELCWTRKYILVNDAFDPLLPLLIKSDYTKIFLYEVRICLMRYCIIKILAERLDLLVPSSSLCNMPSLNLLNLDKRYNPVSIFYRLGTDH